MHPFRETIKQRFNNTSANYGNICAKRSEREAIAEHVERFIDAGGKIEVLPSFHTDTPKVQFGENVGLVL